MSKKKPQTDYTQLDHETLFTLLSEDAAIEELKNRFFGMMQTLQSMSQQQQMVTTAYNNTQNAIENIKYIHEGLVNQMQKLQESQATQ